MTRKQRIYEIAGMLVTGEIHLRCWDEIDMSGLTLHDAHEIIESIKQLLRVNNRISKRLGELAEKNDTPMGYIDIPKMLDSKAKRDNYSA